MKATKFVLGVLNNKTGELVSVAEVSPKEKEDSIAKLKQQLNQGEDIGFMMSFSPMTYPEFNSIKEGEETVLSNEAFKLPGLMTQMNLSLPEAVEILNKWRGKYNPNPIQLLSLNREQKAKQKVQVPVCEFVSTV